MKRKDCEGCATLGSNIRCPYYDDNLICPCSICLVKCMCLVSCDKFDTYRKKISIKIVGAR